MVSLAVGPSLYSSRRRGKEAGGLRGNGDGAEDASPRGRLGGAGAPARAGRMEEGRRGNEVPESRAAVRPAARPHPALGTLPARGPACVPRAPTLPGGKPLYYTRGLEKSGNFAREMLPTLQHAEQEKNVRR